MSIDNKTFHKKDEFNQLDWSQLKYSGHVTNGENFHFGKGGPQYIGGEGWHIEVYDTDNFPVSHEWELPTAISEMFDWMKSCGSDEKLREIQNALKIKS